MISVKDWQGHCCINCQKTNYMCEWAGKKITWISKKSLCKLLKSSFFFVFFFSFFLFKKMFLIDIADILQSQTISIMYFIKKEKQQNHHIFLFNVSVFVFMLHTIWIMFINIWAIFFVLRKFEEKLFWYFCTNIFNLHTEIERMQL